MMMIKILTIAALLAAPTFATAANAVAYTTDTVTYNGVGDQIGSTFDQLVLGGGVGDYTGPGLYVLNNVTFTAGLNSNSAHIDTGTFVGTGNVGYNFSYNVPYQISISSADTITLGGNYVKVGGVGLHINTLVLSSGGESVTGQLTAIAGSVPEPATWSLMIIGFGMIGAARRRTAASIA